MKYLAMVPFVAALVIAPPVTLEPADGTFPWKTLEEATPFQESVHQSACDMHGLIRVKWVKDDEAWVFYFAPESQRYVMLYFRSDRPGKLPDTIASGVVSMEEMTSNALPAGMRMVKFDLDKAGTLCGMLFPEPPKTSLEDECLSESTRSLLKKGSCSASSQSAISTSTQKSLIENG